MHCTPNRLLCTHNSYALRNQKFCATCFIVTFALLRWSGTQSAVSLRCACSETKHNLDSFQRSGGQIFHFQIPRPENMKITAYSLQKTTLVVLAVYYIAVAQFTQPLKIRSTYFRLIWINLQCFTWVLKKMEMLRKILLSSALHICCDIYLPGRCCQAPASQTPFKIDRRPP